MSINSINGNTLLTSGSFPPVRAASTGSALNPAAGGLLVVDGIQLVAGDRVLCKDEVSAINNGIYAASTGPWVRTSDAAGNQNFFSGMAVTVALGTVNAGQTFVCTTTDDPVVVGTSLITFASQQAVTTAQVSATSTTSVSIDTTIAAGGPGSGAGGDLAGTYPSPTLAWIFHVTGKLLTVNNTLTLAGTDATTITFQGTDTYVGRATTDTLTNKTLTSPILTTPTLGAATATTINKVTLTQPATGSTLTIADGKTVTHNASTTFAGTDGKTLTVNNSLTLAGTDATTITFQGTDTYVGRGTTDTLTNKTLTSPVISGGTIDNAVVGGTTPAAGTFTTLNGRAGNSTSNVRAAGQITVQLSATGTGADTTEDTLQTFTLPANTLDANGRGVRIRAWGTYGANANNKTVRLYFGVSIYNSTPLAQNNTAWILEAEVYRTGSNTQTSWATILAGFSDPGAQVNTPNQTDSAGIVIKVTGQNGTASANDIVCNGMSVLVLN